MAQKTKKSASKTRANSPVNPVTKCNVVMSKQEREWRAQDDARVLKNSASIHSDPQRLKAAQAILERDIAEAQSVLGVIKRKSK